MAAVPGAAQTSTTEQQPANLELPAIRPPLLDEPSIDEANASDWQAKLCHCSSCLICCLGCFLPCYLTGQTAERMRDPTMQTARAINMDCLIHAYGVWCHVEFLYVALKRMAIRQDFNIRGSAGKDVLVAYFCPLCATCQQYDEVRARLGPLETGSALGYQPNQGMVVPPAMRQASLPGRTQPASEEANSAPSATA